MFLIEDNSLKRCDVEATNQDKVNDKLQELVRLRREIVAKKEVVSVSQQVPQEQFLVRDNIVFHGFTRREPELGQNNVAHITTKTIYSAPTTMAYCLRAGASTSIGDNVDKTFFKDLSTNENHMLFRNLMKSVPNRETLYTLLNHFEYDVDMLEKFLKAYHPDLYHFRKILPYLELVVVNSLPVDRIKEDMEWFKANQIALLELEKTLNDAEENAEIQKKLKLEFKGQYVDDDNYDDELPF